AVIDEAAKFARGGFLFPGVRRGIISDMTMSKFMDRRGLIARPHGFRTSLRVWSTEVANVPDAVAETAIGHVVGGAVERSYERLDYLDKRQALMERWAGHLLSRRSAKLLQLPT
ncbi:MAG: integrase, partial [Pseudomonadota bacterium]